MALAVLATTLVCQPFAKEVPLLQAFRVRLGIPMLSRPIYLNQPYVEHASALPDICHTWPSTSLRQGPVRLQGLYVLASAAKVQHTLKHTLWDQFFGGPFAIMWMVGVPSAPGRCRVLYWFFTPSAGAPERLAKQAAEPDWKASATSYF